LKKFNPTILADQKALNNLKLLGENMHFHSH